MRGFTPSLTPQDDDAAPALARSRTSLLNTPLSAQVLGPELLQDIQAARLHDAVRHVSSAQALHAGGGGLRYVELHK